MLSLSLFPSKTSLSHALLSLPTNSPTLASLSWHSPILGHLAFSGPRASPLFDVQQGYPLLHMHLEPWVPPCSAPWILSLAPLLRTLCWVQWLAESVPLSICHALAEPPRWQLYQAPISKPLLASTIVSGFCSCIWDESLGGAVSAWPFPQSLLHTLSLYLLLWVFCSS